MFQQDILTRIINVNWPSELIALEFFITSTWQPTGETGSFNEDTVDDKRESEPCGPPSLGLFPIPWTGAAVGWKKQARWDVVLQSIQRGRFNPNASVNGSNGAYEWSGVDGVVIVGGLSFELGHDPPGLTGPDPSQNFPVWHPPGFPRTQSFSDGTVLGGQSNEWLVQFQPITGGDYLDGSGRIVNAPSFGATFKATLEATGEVRGWTLTGPVGCYFWNGSPHGALFPTTPGEVTYRLTDDYVSGAVALREDGDILDDLAIDISGLRVKRSADSTIELVPVAVGGNRDFISVLMGNPQA